MFENLAELIEKPKWYCYKIWVQLWLWNISVNLVPVQWILSYIQLMTYKPKAFLLWTQRFILPYRHACTPNTLFQKEREKYSVTCVHGHKVARQLALYHFPLCHVWALLLYYIVKSPRVHYDFYSRVAHVCFLSHGQNTLFFLSMIYIAQIKIPFYRCLLKQWRVTGTSNSNC